MSKKASFYLEWIILNVIGFTAGSLCGATSDGLIPSVIPGFPGLVTGDLIFGGMIGLGQYIVFSRTKFLPPSMGWVLAHSLGFMLGARSGALLTYRITSDWTMAGIIFGIIMGGSIGLATAVTMYKHFPWKALFAWILVSTLSWILGESLAFAANFSHFMVPLVALAVAGMTGLGLVYIRSRWLSIKS